MIIPNASRAVVDIVKLRDYCLSSVHPVGKHKARVFAFALGMNESDAEELQQALLRAVASQDARAGEKDRFGQRFVIDLPHVHAGRAVTIRSCWMVRASEDFPRLTSCYVL